MLEDELKKTFEQLNIQPRPRTFSAVDIVYRGAAVKRRRRAYAVAATGTGTAVVAVVIAFALNQPPKQGDNSPARPPGPDISTSGSVRPTPSPESVPTSPPDLPHPTTTRPTTSPGHTVTRTTTSPTTTEPPPQTTTTTIIGSPQTTYRPQNTTTG
ncbi:hypothetical protein FHX81_6716 [Saccharothrix saharensis]|uniref:Uncharacterized protein n=1 Tax=Saccharothrix saharensis TaxID=571190 RepID=A0A543JN77_9PSEU|nr:hypothetical protein [Saccharothrix saharensis]TQM84273.1 hypothetical protein FHX81_6716 [Saccharothrix saharensis]